MMDIFKYNKLRRLNNANNMDFFKIVVSIIVIVFSNIYFFSEPDHVTFYVFELILYSSIFLILIDGETKKVISNKTVYPISSKKRAVYDSIFILFISTLTVLLFSVFIVLIAFLFGEKGVEPEVSDSWPFVFLSYKVAFNFSLVFFYFLLSNIKNNKRWWIVFIIGNVSYLILNVLTRFVLYGSFLKRNTVNLVDYSNVIITSIYFGIIGMFILSSVFYMYFGYKKSKPKKGVVNS